MKSYISALNYASIFVAFSYVISMFVYPWVNSGWNWQSVQRVWHDWQALNVGALAYASSIILYNMAIYNAGQHRKQEFAAAKAFLPEALSEVINYLRSCSPVLQEAWKRANDPEDECRTPLKTPRPELSPSYKTVFRDCIKYAPNEVGVYLATILEKLQIHRSRIESLIDEEFQPTSTMIIVTPNISSYLYGLAELYTLVANLFDFARNDEDLDTRNFTFENIQSAYNLLDLRLDQFPGLEQMSKHIIGKKENS